MRGNLFQKKIAVGEPDACWPWQGCRTVEGYGRYGEQKAHRIAWEMQNGPIPSGLFVCHRCDNPPCCNPAHLFLGSPADNFEDMVRKGRYRCGHGPRLTTRGQSHWTRRARHAAV